MKDFLIEILETRGFPVYQQGSMTKDEAYPDSFYTFWNNSADDASHYDNDATGWWWNFDVMFYSVDPSLVDTELLEARKLLKQNGFVVVGKGYDVASDEPTHTGRGINALKFQINKEE